MAKAKGAIEPMEQSLGGDGPVVLSTEGPAVLQRETPDIERSAVLNQQWIDDMKFMEEPVTVTVHESLDEFAENPVRVGNNGINQAFVRGEPIEVKRKFVYALAKARPISYQQDMHVNQASGEVVQRMLPRRALKYPFSVIHDANPNGAAWLKKVLLED
jgi:hypothetical protein